MPGDAPCRPGEWGIPRRVWVKESPQCYGADIDAESPVSPTRTYCLIARVI